MDKNIFSYFLLFLSYALLLSMLSFIVYIISNENKQFKIVYLCSKLLTIKNIVGSNHNLKIINDFSPSGEPIGLNVGYKILLKLVGDNGCQENYRPCGNLDTIGNILCIDEFLDCPINKMKVDSNEKTEYYLNLNYFTTTLNHTTPNYSFFYSKDFTNGKAKVSIIKTEQELKYVTLENFIIDYETYKYFFSDLKTIEESSTLFGDSNYKNDGIQVTENLINIIELIFDIFNEIELELIKLGAKGLLYLISITSADEKKLYIEQMERFKKYLEKRIEENEEKGIDEYFTHIGDNFYAKTYIGFKSLKDLNTFMKFDRTVLSKIFFPNRGATIMVLALMSLSVIIIIILLFIKSDIMTIIITLLRVIFHAITLGYFIYSLVMYLKIHNNKKLKEFKSIQSDDFIKDFIKEFAGECQNYELMISIIIYLCVGASVLNIISLIIICIYK